MDTKALFSPDTAALRAEVYTDGGCEPNPGQGGWAAIIHLGEREWVLHGNDPDTSNNRMELQAAIAALALLDRLYGGCQVDMYTDSTYVRQGITTWIGPWQRNGWQTRTIESVKNQDLWQALLALTQIHNVTWHWLEGHAGHPLNRRADRLATQARRALPAEAAGGHNPLPAGAAKVDVCIKAGGGGGQPGVWAAVLRTGDRTRDLSGSDPAATVNALLIRAATQTLQAISRPCQVTIYSEAEYLVKGAAQWIKGWQARDWRTKDGKAVANRAEWKALLAAAAPHHVTWQLVNPENAPSDMERAAMAASEAFEAIQDASGEADFYHE